MIDPAPPVSDTSACFASGSSPVDILTTTSGCLATRLQMMTLFQRHPRHMHAASRLQLVVRSFAHTGRQDFRRSGTLVSGDTPFPSSLRRSECHDARVSRLYGKLLPLLSLERPHYFVELRASNRPEVTCSRGFSCTFQALQTRV